MTPLEEVSQVYATCEEEGAVFSFVCVPECMCVNASLLLCH